MASSVIKRKVNPIQKDCEMASGRFLTKKRKFSLINGEPVNPEPVNENKISHYNPTSTNECSFEFPRLSQEELKKIYGGRRRRLVMRKSSIEDSEESEDEDGLTVEELKQTEAHKSLINSIRIMAQKQSL